MNSRFIDALASTNFVVLVLNNCANCVSRVKTGRIAMDILTGPVTRVGSPCVLIPVAFLLNGLLSLIVPDTSGLTVVLVTALCPILHRTNVDLLDTTTIVTAATAVVPAPLNSSGITVTTRLTGASVFSNLATDSCIFHCRILISVPALLIVTLTRCF